MSADVSSDFIISILDEKTNSLRAQQGFGQVPLSRKLETQLAAAKFLAQLAAVLPIREKVRRYRAAGAL